MAAVEDIPGIRIEERNTYFITREDVKWTDDEWELAVEAARENDTDHEAWSGLDSKFIVESEIDEVVAEGGLAKAISL